MKFTLRHALGSLSALNFTHGSRGRALVSGCAQAVLVLLVDPSAVAAEPVCRTIAAAERVAVDYVYDGDTIRLGDGRKVRLIGIDTPEIGREGKPSDPVAERARAVLRRLAPRGSRLDLGFDAVRFDRYGRLLAHLLLPDGANVQVEMLERGLATALVVPPRSFGIACYAAAEGRAQSRRIGIWSLPRYQTTAASDLPPSSRGFRIVGGTIRRVGTSRSAIWLNLTPRMAFRVPRRDLEYFTEYDPRDLQGKYVVGRGWLYERNGELRMTVRHPAALDPDW